MDRKDSLRNFTPSLGMGKDRVCADDNVGTAKKDSLTGKNVVKEHTTTYKGGSVTDGGKNKRQG